MKRFIRKDDEAVSPVIAVILMVAITVVLAGVLWAMLSNIGPGDTGTDVTVTTSKSDRGIGWEITLDSVSGELKLEDAKFVFLEGAVQRWERMTIDALPTSIDSGDSVIYAIPYQTGTNVRDSTTNATIVDGSVPKNYELAYMTYIDSNGDGKVTEGDALWIYKDYDANGTDDLTGSYTIKIMTGKGKLAGSENL